MNTECPRCECVNEFFALVAPYYICRRCCWGQRAWIENKPDLVAYDAAFRLLLAEVQRKKDDAEVDELIRGVGK